MYVVICFPIKFWMIHSLQKLHSLIPYVQIYEVKIIKFHKPVYVLAVMFLSHRVRLTIWANYVDGWWQHVRQQGKFCQTKAVAHMWYILLESPQWVHSAYIQITKKISWAKEGPKRQLRFVGIIFPCSPMWRVVGWWHKYKFAKDVSVKGHQTPFLVSLGSFAKRTLIWEAKFKRMDFMRISCFLANACLEKNDFLYCKTGS